MRILIMFLSVLIFIAGCPAISSATVSRIDGNLSDVFSVHVDDDYQRTIAGLRRAIKADPDNYENYSLLALIYDYIGDYENELEALKLEANYMPEDFEDKGIVYGNLARAFLLTGRVDEAKYWIDEADKIDPDNIFNRWHSLAYCILRNQYKTAAKELKRLAELNKTGRDYYYEAYVFALEKVEDKKLIIELFREAVKANPKSPLSHRALGIAMRSLSKEDYEKNMLEAVKEFEKALELAPRYIPAYISIAETYMLLSAKTNKKEAD